MALPVVHSLWIGNALSPLEQLTIASFIHHGHAFQLWTYEEVRDVPRGAVIKDASEIIPKTRVFHYSKAGQFGLGKNSYAGFSDLFRYRLLHLHGGCWVDMDITCLQSLDIAAPYLFRHHHKLPAVGNVLHAPANDKLMAWCYNQLENRLDANNTDWLLPVRILNEGIKKYELTRYIQDISNRDSFPVLLQRLNRDPHTPGSWKVIHWMNEEFSRAGIAKYKFIRGSTIQKLLDQYGIRHVTVSGMDELYYRLKTSLPYYAAINLRYLRSWLRTSST
ncbi:MAG TPA: capsular polysaccharide synthesis protein [Chitinophagaceae bacterium]|nr:capsular polysaccharide synthesis protein [Chitinophagaceae bacterium]